MNIHVSRSITTTRGADGLARRSWTVDDVKSMVRAGIIGEDERFELIDGEIVPMSPKGVSHEVVKKELTRFWVKAIGAETDLLTETTLYINERNFREPDFVLWPRAVAIGDLTPAIVQLLVEVADTSLSYDLGDKARRYEASGIREFWAIDALRMVTHVHLLGAGGRYGAPTVLPHTAPLTPTLLPTLAVRLADLGLEPIVD